ncbi:ATP-dependent (S)-NAD(P)H-hydrate dehydratase [Dorcoceras hygrometricum]|uniref:ATP-dependent (S)-NAD(P)H-hydrate dehydratase n=1 Tax=Dorcoceras hygrometricum TaxID=472368 RepID=A0A2Z7DE97_9LAMI|nr:ATP-dependent (S)-NAD(P)H-hydrate dehydratase [Dorcoceras hygrometricum]
MVDSSTVAATGFFDDWILCAWLQLFATSAFLASGYAKHCSSLLIVDVTADFIIADPALALLFTTADCDDITADVIIAYFRYCASCQLLIRDFFNSIMLTSSLLLAASSSRHANVIIAESRFLFASIQQLISSFSALLIPDFYCSSSSSTFLQQTS